MFMCRNGVDAEDGEVVGAFGVEGSFAAEVEVRVVVKELLDLG